MLDQDQIVEALGKHLESISDVIKWVLLLALVFWWAGVQRQESIHALDITIARRQALFVAIAAFLVANIIVLNRLIRIGYLIEIVAQEKVEQAVTRLAVDQSFVNPFAFFGKSGLARWHSSGGFGFLILIWWFCNSTLYALADELRSPTALILQGLFLALGLLSIKSVNRVLCLMSNRLKEVNSDLYAPFEAMRLPRAIGTFLGIAGGGLFAFVTQIARFL